MIVTDTSGFWSCARNVSRIAPRNVWIRLLRLSGRFIVMRRTNGNGSSTKITSSLIGLGSSGSAPRVMELRGTLSASGRTLAAVTRSTPILHLSIPVHDLAAACDFYVNGLGCEIGRVRDD